MLDDFGVTLSVFSALIHLHLKIFMNLRSKKTYSLQPQKFQWQLFFRQQVWLI